jgi:hypothetical protein
MSRFNMLYMVRLRLSLTGKPKCVTYLLILVVFSQYPTG